MWYFVFAFFIMFFLDILNAAYVHYVARRHPFRASLAAGVITLISVCMILLCFEYSVKIIPPLILGSVAGTYVSVKWFRYRSRK